MATSTLNPETKGQGKGKARVIQVNPESLTELEGADKNVQVSAVIHPKLYHKLIVNLAQDPNNVTGDTLKRTAYSQAIRKALAEYVNYDGELILERGGNVIGIITAFNTIVGSMFEMARTMGAMMNMPEEQQKAFAFDKARSSLASHPQLAGVDVTDDVLEKLWSGAELELDVDDDEDEEDEDDSTPA